ncbi:hypothetical protein Y032_0386g437 [Ancylostoma ceylanicum]|uniref:Uncharacterized protein n=1 Tax=Ancylostoma ceylanicum TaxID=53326 RepID=A0A016RSP3_9BILA|nr:hypothetical protein Y032_0386g437 [Ancylostoma ceylanicum]
MISTREIRITVEIVGEPPENSSFSCSVAIADQLLIDHRLTVGRSSPPSCESRCSSTASRRLLSAVLLRHTHTRGSLIRTFTDDAPQRWCFLIPSMSSYRIVIYPEKVKFAKEHYDVMKKFEAQHHPDIWKWIMDKVGRSENLEILDVSEEACVFAITLAEKHPNNKLTIASRGEKPSFDLPSNVTYKRVDFQKSFADIEDVGVSFYLPLYVTRELVPALK